ncbi:hypothetical protein [Rhodococcus jostii]|uniref:hypothetical protein n=1 Tax=Rhodococcus jostii TaxID=132919 RepID=UPI003634FF05
MLRQQNRAVREVLGEMLMRLIPRYVPTPRDAQDLADEEIAVLGSLEWRRPKGFA